MVLRRGHRRPISGSGRGTLGSFCRSARRCRCSDRNLGSHLKVLTPGQPIYVSAPAPLATRLPITENNSKNQSRVLHDTSPKRRRSRRPDSQSNSGVTQFDDTLRLELASKRIRLAGDNFSMQKVNLMRPQHSVCVLMTTLVWHAVTVWRCRCEDWKTTSAAAFQRRHANARCL